MKRIFISLLFSFCCCLLWAQNEYPIPKNSNLKIDGGGIAFVRPAVTGGWARGINFYNADGAGRTLALGLFGSGNEPQRFYVAYGNESPWSSSLGLHLLPNGNMGIGTVAPQERLSVNGNIRAREVKVEVANWPDYVFKEGYGLMPLSELEIYIKTHRHLPGIPPAKEAEADGIGLAEMNRRLVEKVEELTLYLIEREKDGKRQESKLERLEKELRELKRSQ